MKIQDLRPVLVPLAVLAALTCTPARAADAPSAAITGVFVDVSQIRHDPASNGDTWDYIWADDDNLYSFACDGRGYGHWSGRNVNSSDWTRPASASEVGY